MFPMYWKSDNNKTQQCRTEIFQKQSSPWDINLLPVVKIKAVKITESLGYAVYRSFVGRFILLYISSKTSPYETPIICINPHECSFAPFRTVSHS